MSAAAETALKTETRTGDDDELDHFYCCDENRALCGADITDALEVAVDDDQLCVVCDDLDRYPCEVCGEGGLR